MQLRPAAFEKLASFICGDPPLPFPYRSSSKLTAFFTGLDLDYIAHTLGKHVIPITQTLEHVPSNLHGHRALRYTGTNSQGLRKLTSDLQERLSTIKNGPALGKSPLVR